MEFRGLAFKSTQLSTTNYYGGEKEQMLNLNQRLETYLNRVKLLDEENAKLAKEIETLRKKHRGSREHRKLLDEQLREARQEVDHLWRERFYAQVDVARLSEELQALDLQLQQETQAQIEANVKAEQSRRELEEERRAQIWLKEKVNQLEHEMKSLIQSHQEEVANMEVTLMQAKVMPSMRPSVQQAGVNLLDLGQEYNQRAAKAWQEATEAYQGQLARLEESVKETRQRLMEVNKEKSESVLKLQNLDREMLGLQELREHLESTVDQQRESHCRDVQMLQEHLEALERERHALAQKMDQLLQENRGLVQIKMSLNMEVATYRALLDSESLKGDISLQKQSGHIYSKDAVFSPWGDNYQLSPCPKTTSSLSVHNMTARTKQPAITVTPIRYQKYVPRREILDISKKKLEDNEVSQQPDYTPYPKVLKDGAVENFRPQEVNEKVTYAEPFSPSDEKEKTFDLENNTDSQNDTVDQPSGEQLKTSLKNKGLKEADLKLVEPMRTEESSSFPMNFEPKETQTEKEDIEKPQSATDAWIEEKIVSKTEQPWVKSSLSYELESSSHFEEPFGEANPEVVEEEFTEESHSITIKSQPEKSFESEEMEKPHKMIEAWVEKESVEDMKAMQERVSSDSETEAFVEPNYDTKSSSQASDCEPEESLRNELGVIVKEDFTFDRNGVSKDGISPPKDKLYPDGEEMDTWDSVMEQNQDLKDADLEQPQEVLKQHAEPEEDISVKEVLQQKQEAIQDEEMKAKFEPLSVNEEKKDSINEDLTDKSEDDEQENSQNVSLSWRTELEGDSYAQENTLADTRPLIRYKSDETDANTQASHVDDVDSSDGEQDKKSGEMGSGAWIEDQTRRFGTMEDLCEEAEGDVLDEEYDLEYLREDGKADKEELDKDEEKTQEEVIRTMVDEELDTDKLVEQELENLTTECYTTHFAHHQDSAKDTLQTEILSEQPIAWGEALEGMPETADQEDFLPDEVLVNQNNDEHFEVKKNDAAVQDLVEAEEEDKHDVSLVTHCDTTEDISELRKELVWSSTSQELSFDNLSFEQKEPENMGDNTEQRHLTGQDSLTGLVDQFVNENEPSKSSSTVAEVSPDNEVQMRDTTPEEIFVPEEGDSEFHKVLATTKEWEIAENIIENPHHDDTTDLNSALKGLTTDDKVDQESLSPQNMSPESVHDDGDLFIVKDSKELLKTNVKTNLDDMFSINVNNDFWASPLETGATYQPDDDDNKHAEWKLGFGDVEARETEESVEKSDMTYEQKEVSQVFTKNVVKGEIVHSEESEDDSEAMSSGEE